jgi:hypothetical protein
VLWRAAAVLGQQAVLWQAVPLVRLRQAPVRQAPVRRARRRQVVLGQLEAGELGRQEVQPARRPGHLPDFRYGQPRC